MGLHPWQRYDPAELGRERFDMRSWLLVLGCLRDVARSYQDMCVALKPLSSLCIACGWYSTHRLVRSVEQFVTFVHPECVPGFLEFTCGDVFQFYMRWSSLPDACMYAGVSERMRTWCAAVVT